MEEKKIAITLEGASTNPPIQQPTQDPLLSYLTEDIKQLKDRIENLEKKYVPPESFFKSINRVNNWVLVIFLFLPIIQLALMLILFIYFNKSDLFTKISQWVIGFIGLGVIFELIYVPYKIRIIEDKLNKEK